MVIVKKVQIDEEVLIEWVYGFLIENQKTPGIRDLYRHKGCPYSKSAILQKYKNLSSLYNKYGLKRKEQGYDNITDDVLLEDLRSFVIKYKTTDRDTLKKNGLYDRAVYERRFGSWSNALKLSGINNSFKILMKYFEDYDGSDYISFLKQRIGVNGDFSDTQLEIIKKAKKLECDTKKIRNSINYKYIKENFVSVSVLLVCCGIEPSVSYCSGNTYIADDGHICDSGKEVQLDNFLSCNNIEHEVHCNYPNSQMKCDFKVKDFYIEYAGLMDKSKYAKDIERKVKFANENQIKQIILYELNEDTLTKLQAALTSDC